MIPTTDKYNIGDMVKMVNCLGLDPIVGKVISKTKYTLTIDNNGTPTTGSTTLCMLIDT